MVLEGKLRASIHGSSVMLRQARLRTRLITEDLLALTRGGTP